MYDGYVEHHKNEQLEASALKLHDKKYVGSWLDVEPMVQGRVTTEDQVVLGNNEHVCAATGAVCVSISSTWHSTQTLPLRTFLPQIALKLKKNFQACEYVHGTNTCILVWKSDANKNSHQITNLEIWYYLSWKVAEFQSP